MGGSSGRGLAGWRDADKVALASGLTLPFAMARADAALYDAKHAGRDRVAVAR